MATKIDREPVRESVADRLSSLILGGTFRPGSVVGVARAARELDVSATPVREALIQLEQRGLVLVQPGRGFIVPPLSSAEMDDLYRTVSLFECAALATVDRPTDARQKRLARINRSLAGATGERAFVLDMQWHEELFAGSSSPLVRETLAGLRLRCRRYELVYMSVTERAENSAQQHEAILAAMVAEDRSLAAELLEQNWVGNISRVAAELLADERIRGG